MSLIKIYYFSNFLSIISTTEKEIYYLRHLRKFSYIAKSVSGQGWGWGEPQASSHLLYRPGNQGEGLIQDQTAGDWLRPSWSPRLSDILPFLFAAPANSCPNSVFSIILMLQNTA